MHLMVTWWSRRVAVAHTGRLDDPLRLDAQPFPEEGLPSRLNPVVLDGIHQLDVYAPERLKDQARPRLEESSGFQPDLRLERLAHVEPALA